MTHRNLYQDNLAPKPAAKLAPGERHAFQGPDASASTQKKLELNLNNKASLTEALPKPTTRMEGQKFAEDTNKRLNDYTAKGGQFALAFKQILNDKTLPINKSIIAKDAEKGLISDWISLAMAQNNDIGQDEGQGSMSIIMFLLGTVLAQRDKINELGYADEQHAKHITQLEKQLKAIDMVMAAQAAIDKPKVDG